MYAIYTSRILIKDILNMIFRYHFITANVSFGYCTCMAILQVTMSVKVFYNYTCIFQNVLDYNIYILLNFFETY